MLELLLSEKSIVMVAQHSKWPLHVSESLIHEDYQLYLLKENRII